ncbi:phage protein GP46 [Escherichia coli]|nr:phage protein GP46 [Escherichia coli]
MSDIASFWNVDEMFADWQKGLGELTTGNDLQTAILDSLFTDRLARADDDYEDSDRRGWWGDSGEESQLGSRLWLLRRKKLTPDVAKKSGGILE